MRVIVLGHKKLRPPQRVVALRERLRAAWRTEYDLVHHLRRMGHQVSYVGLDDSLEPLLKAIQFDKPEVLFNLVEEFSGISDFDFNIVSLLEMLNVPFTGCGSRGMLLARDKALAKVLVASTGIATPRFWVVDQNQSTENLKLMQLSFPLIVKSQIEDASLGIGAKSVVRNVRQAAHAIRNLRKMCGGPLLLEEYIEGREFYVAVVGGGRPIALPPRELCFGGLPKSHPRVATRRVKWNLEFRLRHGIYTRSLPRTERKLIGDLESMAKKTAQVLSQDGYCRIDFRQDKRGEIYFLESNPNPQICEHEDFADAAKLAGLNYPALLERLLIQAKNRSYSSAHRYLSPNSWPG